MRAEAKIINSKNEVIEISKEFKDHKGAEALVVKMFDNKRCVHAGCSTLAMARLEIADWWGKQEIFYTMNVAGRGTETLEIK